MDAIDRLESLLPHRRPMVLLAEVLPETVQGVSEARIDASEKCPFFDHGIGGVPSCVALEYMAQAMAVAVGREMRRNGGEPAVGFVVGTRAMDILVDMFEPGTDYIVRAECTYEDGEFASFDCSISDSGGVVAAKATLMAFRPGNIAEFEEVS